MYRDLQRNRAQGCKRKGKRSMCVRVGAWGMRDSEAVQKLGVLRAIIRRHKEEASGPCGCTDREA